MQANTSSCVAHIFPYPSEMMARSEYLRFSGQLVPRTLCTPDPDAMLNTAVQLSTRAAEVVWRLGGTSFIPPWMLLALYGTFSVCFLGHVLYSVKRSPSQKSRTKWPMADAWHCGFLCWNLRIFVLDFVTNWISHWGNVSDSNSTIIRPEELESVSYPNDDAGSCYQTFQQLWQKELESTQQHHASLIRTVTRFITYPKLVALVVWSGVFEIVMLLVPPLVMQGATDYLNWLFVERELGHDVPMASLIGPSVVFIVAFTGVPLCMGFADTMSAMLAGRIALRTGGCVSCAIYKKAQRLPVHMSKQNAQDSNVALGLHKIPVNQDFQHISSEERSESDSAGDEFQELIEQEDLPSQFNLTSLVLVDTSDQLSALPLCLGRIVVLIPTALTLFVFVCMKLRAAVFIAIGAVVGMIVILTLITLPQGYYFLWFLNCVHERLAFFQNVIYGIRHIKACGEEWKCRKTCDAMREKEVSALSGFYTCLGLVFGLYEQYPNVILLSSLGGLWLIYGDVSPTTIFTIIPWISSMQSAVLGISQAIPMLVMALPSFGRIEAFLQLSEAPPLVLERKLAKPLAKDVSCVTQNLDDWLTMQGDFARSLRDEPALREVNISIRPGELIAVLGQVGSGKTTLLHGMLGELYPTREARQLFPRKIAYASQVPYIIEGTLKTNVIHDERYDEARYNDAVYAACLEHDIRMLPGGDGVLIGSRGITLSGGQRARVSMARAAYSFDTSIALIDDPFGAVDWGTGQHIMDHLVCGPLLQGKTRVIAMQPDPERLRRFNRVLIVVEGVVRVDGTPDEAMATPEYQMLLATRQDASANDGDSSEDRGQPVTESGTRRGPPEQSVITQESPEKENQGRADTSTYLYFLGLGGIYNIVSSATWSVIKNTFDTMERMTLASWTTSGSMYMAGISAVPALPGTYIKQFCFWWMLSLCSWFASWNGGQAFTIRISRGAYEDVVRALMRAPIDRFYDRTPVGRIMNRLSQDQVQIDTQLYVKICRALTYTWQCGVPIVFVHCLMPMAFTIFSLPFYFLSITLFRMFWRTMVPLRYTVQTTRSLVSAECAEVESNIVAMRAFLKADQRFQTFQAVLDHVFNTNFIHNTLLKRWLSCRIFAISGLFVTWIALIAVWVEGAFSIGNAVFCILQMFQMMFIIDQAIDMSSEAQYQIVAMNRIHEYTMLLEERPDLVPSDGRFTDFVASFSRAELGELRTEKDLAGVWHVLRDRPWPEIVLDALPGQKAFVAHEGLRLLDLCPSCEALAVAEAWHRVVAVNGVSGSTEELAKELCHGSSDRVAIQVRSGWLADGAAVAFEDLQAGYGDLSPDIISHVSFEVPRKTKVGIMGHTGCGKSTMLLCMLRILEPRAGRIMLEGVDTQSLGLRTLRSAMGVVPQEPVLLQGTLRSNIDTFAWHSDDSVWNVLRLVQLEEVVNGLEGGLNCAIEAGGSNLSYGQRQLVSLARIILKSPMLLMLDEATSSIDPRTQETVLSTVFSTLPDATMMVITHRLETILKFDMGIVMEKGAVVECGLVKDLVEHGQSLQKLKGRLR